MFSILKLKVQRTSRSFKSFFGALEDAGGPDWGLASWFRYGHWSLIHPWFWLSILILKVQRTSMSFKSWFWALVGAEGSWLGFGSWFWFGYSHWSLMYLCSKFRLSILSFKMLRSSMSFKSCNDFLEDFRDSWLRFKSWSWFGYGHWTLTHPCSVL